jgi:hypothetical protein
VDRNVRALIVALLCVLAVSVAAATLVNPDSPTGAGPGTGDVTEPGGDSEQGPQEESSEGSQSQQSGQRVQLLGGACIPFLLTPTFFGIAFLAIGALMWYLKRRDGGVYALAVTFPLVLFCMPLYFVLTDCGQEIPEETEGAFGANITQPPGGGQAGGEAGGQAATQFLSPSVVLAAILVLAVVFVALVYRASDDDAADDDDPVEVLEQPEPDDEEALAAVGAAAGDAADRIEDAADVENEVYRAWRDMTEHVNVPDPETSTPREFASAARDAGMDESHVTTLTDLFRDVRYGGADATEDREERALDALRAIEERYADGGEGA